MKILDASTLIAICNEIHRPELLDKIGLLGHDLIIPAYVVKNELIDKNSIGITKKYVRQNKIRVSNMNTSEEIQEFKKDFSGLSSGECDTMLSYRKLDSAGRRAYCILDDGKARKRAEELGMRFTGLVGLLKLMKQRNIMSHDEVAKVVKLLKDSKFRFPTGVVI